MTQPIHKFKLVPKDRLFYDQFEYCVGFYLQEVNCLRDLDHACIDDVIEKRKQWREIAQQRWINGRQKHGTFMSRLWQEITDEIVTNLHALADVLITAPEEFKLVVSVNQAYVYTNNLALIDRLDGMSILEFKTFAQAQVARPRNTVALKNPRHRFRSYFKLKNLAAQQRDHLEAFFQNHQDTVRLSPALREWLAMPFNRLQDYFFVDHDTESWLTMLNLVVPGMIRKTVQIIPAK